MAGHADADSKPAAEEGRDRRLIDAHPYYWQSHARRDASLPCSETTMGSKLSQENERLFEDEGLEFDSDTLVEDESQVASSWLGTELDYSDDASELSIHEDNNEGQFSFGDLFGSGDENEEYQEEVVEVGEEEEGEEEEEEEGEESSRK